MGFFPIARLLPITRSRVSHIPWRPRFYQLQSRLNTTTAPPTPILTPPPAFTPASSPVVLRDYQEECIQAVLNHIFQGHQRLGISLATGAGKTVIFTQLIGRIPPRNSSADKTLIVVHRRELVDQAEQHCRRAHPDRTISIEMGNSKADVSSDIIIASIRSLTSKDRIARFDPSRFKLILVDEAHHIVARTYRDMLEYFGLDDKDKRKRQLQLDQDQELTPSLGDVQGEQRKDRPILVGVSATFSRADGLQLGAAIDHIVYHKDYMDMIDEKWLANAVFTTVRSEADLSRVRKDRFGDFALKSLSHAVNTPRSNEITVRAWLANAAGRKSTLVFCVDIDHTRQLTEAFRAAGIDARYITSNTPRDVRDAQLRAFRAHHFPILLNCGLFTEGTDIPNIDCVLLARPTRSRNLLIQMIGRGLRLHPGKHDCHIIDMVATLGTGVLSTPTLFGLHPDEVLAAAHGNDLRERQQKEIEIGIDPTPDEAEPGNDLDGISLTFTKYDTIYDLLHDIKSEKRIRSLSRHCWVRVGPDRYLLSDATGWLTIEKADSDSPGDNDPSWTVRHVSKFKCPTTEATKYTRARTVAATPDFEAAVHAADTFAAARFEARYIVADQPWRRHPATRSQLAFLNQQKLRKEALRFDQLTRGQAADMITRLIFGGKKRLEAMKARRMREEKTREVERLSRRDVKVGPVNW
ncbi:P-loop containing nucleoside triphosphate hydrolase protein [Aspergillus ambiguus]|uniref:DEAD/DEAH box helicase n=1 Tax=Aspergillus ambiguus TaxID=176160 RepID=UPI003CCD45E0